MVERKSPAALQELHHHGGKTGPAQASRLAEVVVLEIPNGDFDNFEVANELGEYARIAVVSALTAAKHSQTWLEAKEFLMRALVIIDGYYPVGTSSDEAIKRGNYWETVYGSESAQLICLRDSIQLCELLFHIYPHEDMSGLLSGLQHLMMRLLHEKPQRFGYIYQIERAEYPEAVQAYVTLLDQYKTIASPEQLITVTTRMLGRSLTASDHSTTRLCASVLVHVAAKNLHLLVYAQNELFKNISANIKNKVLKAKVKHWLQELENDGDKSYFFKLLQTFVENRYFGSGEDTVNIIY